MQERTEVDYYNIVSIKSGQSPQNYDQLSRLEIKETGEGSIPMPNSSIPSLCYESLNTFYQIDPIVYLSMFEHISPIVNISKEKKKTVVGIRQFPILYNIVQLDSEQYKESKFASIIKHLSDDKPLVFKLGEKFIQANFRTRADVLSTVILGHKLIEEIWCEVVELNEDVINKLKPYCAIIGQYQIDDEKISCNHWMFLPNREMQADDRQLLNPILAHPNSDEAYEKMCEEMEKVTNSKSREENDDVSKKIDLAGFSQSKWWILSLVAVFIGAVVFEIFAGIYKWRLSLGLLHDAPAWLIGVVSLSAILVGYIAISYATYKYKIHKEYEMTSFTLRPSGSDDVTLARGVNNPVVANTHTATVTSTL